MVLIGALSDGDLVWATILLIFGLPIIGYTLAFIGSIIDKITKK